MMQTAQATVHADTTHKVLGDTTVGLDVDRITTWLYHPASSNLRVIAWVVVMLGLFIFLARAGRAAANYWKQNNAAITQWVATAPTTNLRVLLGIVLGLVFVVGTMLAFALGFSISGEALLYVGSFILLQMGLDVTAYGVKRATFKPEALGMTRESVNPQPAQPAAAMVQETGQPVVTQPGQTVAPPAAPAVNATPVNPPLIVVTPAADQPGASIPGTGD